MSENNNQSECECGHWKTRHNPDCEVCPECNGFTAPVTPTPTDSEEWVEELKLMIARQGNGVSMNQCIEKVRSLLHSERERVAEAIENIKPRNQPNPLKAELAHNKEERNAMYYNRGYNQALKDVLKIINKGNTR